MVIMIKTFIKKNIITLTLAILLLVLSVVSLFIGAIDINIKNFFMDSQAMEVFVISRLPRLLAILCTGIGISVAGLIMQQLCMNKFVSPTTGATISSAQVVVPCVHKGDDCCCRIRRFHGRHIHTKENSCLA